MSAPNQETANVNAPAATTASTPSLLCPRCRSTEVHVRANSPVSGVWTIYGCQVCLYTWRSTESEENTNPDKYPTVFRLTPDDLANLPVIPTIPSRRSH